MLNDMCTQCAIIYTIAQKWRNDLHHMTASTNTCYYVPVSATLLHNTTMCLTPQLNKRQLEGGDHLVAVYGDNFLSAAHFGLSALAVSPATASQQAALQRGDAELLQKRLALTDFQVKQLVTVRHVNTSVYMHTVMYSLCSMLLQWRCVAVVPTYCCMYW
jgi:hypothetical protein